MLAFLLAVLLPAGFKGTIGYAALDLETGRAITMKGGGRFPMGSVFKFPLAFTVLRLVDEKKLSLDTEYTIQPADFSPGYSPIRDNAHGQPVTLTLRELMRYALGVSDNTAADFMMKLIGGPRVVTRRLRELGVRDVRVDRSEKEMAADLSKKGGVDRYARDPRDTSTPQGMIELLKCFYEKRDGLSPENHDFAMKTMLETKTGARRIVSALPQGATFAHKTGTMPGTTNDAGIITSPDGKHHIAVVVFVKGAKERDDVIEAAIASVGRQLYDALIAETDSGPIRQSSRAAARSGGSRARADRARSSPSARTM